MRTRQSNVFTKKNRKVIHPAIITYREQSKSILKAFEAKMISLIKDVNEQFDIVLNSIPGEDLDLTLTQFQEKSAKNSVHLNLLTQNSKETSGIMNQSLLDKIERTAKKNTKGVVTPWVKQIPIVPLKFAVGKPIQLENLRTAHPEELLVSLSGSPVQPFIPSLALLNNLNLTEIESLNSPEIKQLKKFKRKLSILLENSNIL